MYIADILASNITATGYQELPGGAVEVARKQILDSLGLALAGSSAAGAKELVDIAKGWGGKPESTILAFGDKVPAPEAAQVNAYMIHALDFDDTHDASAVHTAPVAVSAALAIAERQGKVSGREFITAVALGVDLACRMGLATRLRKKIHAAGGWHPTALYGVFSAAAIAGKLLGLDREGIANALGIAYSQAAGNVQGVVDGSLTKRLQAGFAARGGIISALMAQKGLTGARSCIEGEAGIYNLYHDGGDFDKLTSQLGQHFEGVNISFKPYPCCRVGHKCIDTTLEMVKQHDIKPGEVKGVEVTAGNMTWTALCQPIEVKRQPRNVVDAQFSLPWMLACAVVRRKVGLKEFTGEAIIATDLLEMAGKVAPVLDSNLEERMDTPLDVRIKTVRGDFAAKTGAIYGSPEKPMTMEAIIEKFRDCAAIAVRPVPAKALDRVITMVAGLEEVNDVSQLCRLLR